MDMTYNCHNCGEEMMFESEKAERVHEPGTKGQIYKTFCMYCGAENFTLWSGTPPVEVDPALMRGRG